MSETAPARIPLPPPEEIAKLPPDGGPDFNRLIHAASPYLLQHARNPVDWYPWSDEAFDRARVENKPVFLSVGYSSCHWCHVMEHESFEHPDVAEVLNRRYVAIKVDREERPDIDDLYMTATQLMTGRGGWPNSLWLMPDRRPWYAGTYFPREDRPGMAGFITHLEKLADLWSADPEKVARQATELSAAIVRQSGLPAQEKPSPASYGPIDPAAHAREVLSRSFDAREGGFGGAPKFPPHSSLRLLLRRMETHPEDEQARTMVIKTLDAMMQGGIHDHIGGGFHRYSTDDRWLLPHFEKMLYDNAQVLWNYAEAYRLTKEPGYAETALRTGQWILREMSDPDGGFYSALDADSEGEEGKFYVWPYEEILSTLGDEDGLRLAGLYRMKPGGNFHDEASGQPSGLNIPHLSGALSAEDETFAAAQRERLLRQRDLRIRPGLDDKVITSWNGLMIEALAHAGRVLPHPPFVERAARAADWYLREMIGADRLPRIWRRGTSSTPGFLDDYAALACGLLSLHEARPEPRWLEAASSLVASIDRRFYDDEAGGYFSSSDRHETLLIRAKESYDQAMPSGNALALRAHNLLRRHYPDEKSRQKARRTARLFTPLMMRIPSGTAAIITETAILEGSAGRDLAFERFPVSARIEFEPPVIPPGGSSEMRLLLDIDEGWHINADKTTGDELIPTSLTFSLPGGLEAGPVRYPAPELLAAGGLEKIPVFSGSLILRTVISAKNEAPAGDNEGELVLRFQACDDRSCAKPETVSFRVRIQVATEPGTH